MLSLPKCVFMSRFSPENPDSEKDFAEQLNPNSLKTIQAWVEPALAEGQPGDLFQFLRNGYLHGC